MMVDIDGTKYHINMYNIYSKFIENQNISKIEFSLAYPVLDFIVISIKLWP